MAAYTHPVTTEQIIELKNQGLSYTQISKRLKMIKGNISKRLAAWEREKISRELPLPMKINTSKPNIIGEILNMITSLDRKIVEVDRAAKKFKRGSKERRDWEKLSLKLAMERRRLLAFGSDTEYRLSQFAEVKHVLFIMLEEIRSEGPEIANRILLRLKGLRDSGLANL